MRGDDVDECEPDVHLKWDSSIAASDVARLSARNQHVG